jgi:hypothetical protein
MMWGGTLLKPLKREKITFLIRGMVWYGTLPKPMKKMGSDGHPFDASRSPPHS